MMHYTPEKEVVAHLHARGCKVVLAEEKDRVGPVGKSMHFVFIKEAKRRKDDDSVEGGSRRRRRRKRPKNTDVEGGSRESDLASPAHTPELVVPEDAARPESALSSEQADPECSALESGRQFAYRDEECGLLEFHVKDLNAAFQIEQAYWKEQGELDPWFAVDTQLPHG